MSVVFPHPEGPIIAVTGSTRTSDIYKFTYQEVDEMPFFTSTTKWNATITGAERAAEIIRNAFQIAMSGNPGPVHVNFPYDVASEKVEIPDVYADKRYTRYPAKRFRPDVEEVKAAAKLLVRAERPVIVAGVGIGVGAGSVLLIQSAISRN